MFLAVPWKLTNLGAYHPTSCMEMKDMRTEDVCVLAYRVTPPPPPYYTVHYPYVYQYPGWAGYKKCILPQRPAENNVHKKIANILNKNIVSFLTVSCIDS